MTTTTLQNCVLEQFMICAFRYALDRRTGVLSEILEYMEPHWNALNPTFQRQIKDDIKRKLEIIDHNDFMACIRILEL